MDEVRKHNTPSDCWVVIHGKVYDLTSFLGEQPGAYLGDVDPATINAADSATQPEQHENQLVPAGEVPTIDRMLNFFDFEAVAKAKMGRSGWDYYSSGGDDEITLRENHIAFQRLWLRPRVLR